MKSPLHRFANKVAVVPGSCWLWLGSLDDKGYGRFDLNGRKVRAHRWAYEHFVGPIPDGLVIDHLCRVRNCVRPDHLQPVTSRENTQRGNSGKWARAKTHCPRGHPYDEINTRVNAQGARECHTCQLAKYRRYRDRRRVASTERRVA